MNPKYKKVIQYVVLMLLVVFIILDVRYNLFSDAYRKIEQLENNIIPQESIEQQTLYPVVKVVDGDTIDVLIDGKKERVRLLGINTPESVDPRREVECFGEEASDYLKYLLQGELVILKADENQHNRDQYDRLLRYVYLDDNETHINFEMILQGYAYVYNDGSPYNYKFVFQAAENEARLAQRGLWGEACHVN